ncbi:MAG: hypothetical protein QM536_05630 [Chitinophagaceae bacterium]|nr:hypothetical protein [Chitinophagaceae bacterium]
MSIFLIEYILSLKITEWVSLLANLAVIIGVFFGVFQVFQYNRYIKSEHKKNLIEIFDYWRLSDDLNNLFYELQYNTFTFDLQKDLGGSDKEKNLDKLLENLIKLGITFEHKIITKEDLKLFEYEFNIIYYNEEVKKYIVTIIKSGNPTTALKSKIEQFKYLELIDKTINGS